MLKVAIIGSGPAGCYVAEHLAKARPGAVEVDVFERLPTPFGLVRGGVAPDHQTTKSVARVLARALAHPEVRFFGNVEIGPDLPLAVLRDAYDAVVVAVGAPADGRLGIPGETLPGVVGSAAFVGWYNGHPASADLCIDLTRTRSAVIIGNGNVAVDVARVLGRAGCEMGRSDLDPDVEAQIVAAPLERIVIAGRRGPAEVRFTPVELEELGRLVRVRPRVHAGDLEETGDADNPALGVLRAFAAAADRAAPVSLEFAFHLRPEAFIADGEGRLAAVRFRRTRGARGRSPGAEGWLDIPAELAVTCIGYRCVPLDGLLPGRAGFTNAAGRICDRLYVAGWAGRAPSGTIATNRPEAYAVADRVLAEVAAAERPGRDAVADRLGTVPVVDLDGWRRIDAAECDRAGDGRVRRKFRRIDEFLAIAHAPGGHPGRDPVGSIGSKPRCADREGKTKPWTECSSPP